MVLWVKKCQRSSNVLRKKLHKFMRLESPEYCFKFMHICTILGPKVRYLVKKYSL